MDIYQVSKYENIADRLKRLGSPPASSAKPHEFSHHPSVKANRTN
jgi:hypothetical protein